MLSSKMQFNRNAMLNREQLTVKEKGELPEDADKQVDVKKLNEDLKKAQEETKPRNPTLPLVFYTKNNTSSTEANKDV